MAQAEQVINVQQKPSNITTLRRSVLTPGLASAAKRFGLRPDAVKRHEEFVTERQHELEIAKLERDATKAKYQALKGTVDQLVERIQDVAAEPARAQASDIQNIRTLLKQAYHAMERQQVELKGIRARTQRMERAALRVDGVHTEVTDLRAEISGYQKSLHMVRNDMATLLEVVENDGGLKDLVQEVSVIRTDLDDNRSRTHHLELNADEQSARTLKLENELATLRALVQSNMSETAGVAGALLNLREEVAGLRKRIGKYIIDQMRFVRQG
jgi:chromosome segregation ATPase